MYKIRILIVLFLIANFSISLKAEVLSCKKSGKIIFTDDKRNCDSNVSKLKMQNIEDKRKNYRYPQRQYENYSSRFTID